MGLVFNLGGLRLKSADDGWMYTTCPSSIVLYPSCGSFLAACVKKPEQMALRT
tara:strand:- start:123 stop:281 length:159 start_codon:yes stop_codon:yes gene_type:complete